MKAVALKKDVYWVGALDWAVRDFHGYETPRGTSYNNYLVLDDEITLIDTVKYDFADITLKNICGVIDPARIKNVIINHIENDHATSLDRIMALCPGCDHLYYRKREARPRAFFRSRQMEDEGCQERRHALTTGRKTFRFHRDADAPLA